MALCCRVDPLQPIEPVVQRNAHPLHDAVLCGYINTFWTLLLSCLLLRPIAFTEGAMCGLIAAIGHLPVQELPVEHGAVLGPTKVVTGPIIVAQCTLTAMLPAGEWPLDGKPVVVILPRCRPQLQHVSQQLLHLRAGNLGKSAAICCAPCGRLTPGQVTVAYQIFLGGDDRTADPVAVEGENCVGLSIAGHCRLWIIGRLGR